jgi:hypothetical protein
MEVWVSKGFLVLAQNTTDVDYIQQAYALALSIKFSQNTVSSISIVTNDIVPDEYKSVFDHIIPIPWFNEGTRYKAENRWKLYHITPYEETIVLDTDMLLLEDITEWWNYCSNHYLKFASRIKNHKNELVTDTVYRKTFIINKLPSPYFALHYFKKSQAAYEFYKVLEFVCNNWEWCYTKFAPEEYQDWLSMDLAVAIAIEITGEYASVFDSCSPLEFTHMKPMIQSWDAVPANWQDGVHSLLTKKGDFLVGNTKQSKLFHYVEKSFLNDKIIKRLKELANGKTASTV